MNRKFQKLYPPQPNSKQQQFVKFRVIGDYNSLYAKCVRLKQNIDKLNSVRQQNKSLGERQTMKVYRGLIGFCCGEVVDCQEYYVQKINQIKEDIRKERLEQQKRNSGVGFLLVADHSIVNDFIYEP